MRPKNLIFLFTDQQRYDTLAAYGNSTIRVPNLNRLAEQSAVFDRAYVTQPVCTPSRASIMSGLFPHNTGCMENNQILGDNVPTFVELLPKGAYKSAYIGKWHLGNEVKRQHGFDQWVSTEEYRESLSDPRDIVLNSDHSRFLLRNGYKPDQETSEYSTFSRYFCTRIPVAHSKPAFTADRALEFIRECGDEPFILYVNFLEPHPPYYSANDDLYDESDVELPPRFDCEPSADTPVKYQANRHFQRNVGRHFPLPDEKAWRRQIGRYWGEVTLVDTYVGKILADLDSAGHVDDTVVVFTSDHGDMMGDFRMAQKSVMYDPAVRVPLLFKVPGITDGGIRIEKPVSLVDLVPTLLELLGEAPYDRLDGKSLAPVVRGDTGYAGDAFIEWTGDEGENKWFAAPDLPIEKERVDRVYAAAMRAVVTEDMWKLSLTSAGEHELYDLNTDPLELVNLYNRAGAESKRAALRGKIESWQKKTGDTVVLPW